MYKSDNQDDQQLAERGIWDNQDYVVTIAPFVQTENDRGATMAMELQHAGKDVWEDGIKNAEDFLKNQNGLGPQSLVS